MVLSKNKNKHKYIYTYIHTYIHTYMHTYRKGEMRLTWNVAQKMKY